MLRMLMLQRLNGIFSVIRHMPSCNSLLGTNWLVKLTLVFSLFRRFPFTMKIKTQILNAENLQISKFVQKSCLKYKMLMKLATCLQLKHPFDLKRFFKDNIRKQTYITKRKKTVWPHCHYMVKIGNTCTGIPHYSQLCYLR